MHPHWGTATDTNEVLPKCGSVQGCEQLYVGFAVSKTVDFLGWGEA